MIGYELTIPIAPSVNHYYQRTSGGGMRISDRGQFFRAEVRNAVVRSKMPKLTGRLWVTLRVFPPDKRARDLDNFCKAALDALQHGGAFENDGLIDDLQVTRGPIVPGGRIEVILGEIVS
jgi:crossover junction endodeoxyribonuclease RusA